MENVPSFEYNQPPSKSSIIGIKLIGAICYPLMAIGAFVLINTLTSRRLTDGETVFGLIMGPIALGSRFIYRLIKDIKASQSETLAKQGDKFRADGSYKEAMTCYNKAIKIFWLIGYDGNPNVHLKRAKLYAEANQYNFAHTDCTLFIDMTQWDSSKYWTEDELFDAKLLLEVLKSKLDNSNPP